MTWGATFDVPGTSPEFYDRALKMLLDEVPQGIPEGCIVHFMSPTADGYRITEVWESEEQFQRFRREIQRPLLLRLVGEESLNQPDPQPFPVHAVRARSTK